MDLTEQSTYTFQVRLAEDFVNVENMENIVVEFDTEGLASTYLNLSEFYVVNAPGDYTITPMTQTLYKYDWHPLPPLSAKSGLPLWTDPMDRLWDLDLTER